MKRNRTSTVFLVLSFVVLFGGLSYAADDAKSFKAKIKMAVKAMPQTADALLFVDGLKVRVESPQQVLILRADLGTMYSLIPATKSYYEAPINFDALAQYAPNSLDSEKKESVGTDSCGGEACDKQRVALVDGFEKEHPIYQWTLKDGRVVKREAIDGSWTHLYSDVEVGPQPAHLFDLRKDYQKAS